MGTGKGSSKMPTAKSSLGFLLCVLVIALSGCGQDTSGGIKETVEEDSGTYDVSTDSEADTNGDLGTETEADPGSDAEEDTQGDTATAQEDLCPDDPNKTEPGECGCGVPEGECSAEPAWRFVVVGDSRGSDNGVNTAAWGHLVGAILEEGAEFVLFPGDLTTSGTASQFEQWKKTTTPLYESSIAVYAVRGNHDDASLSAWNNAFSGEYRFPQNGPEGEKNLTYSFNNKNAFVVGIDNYSTSSKVNQSWLDVQFAQNKEPHVFVFGHEPAFAASHQDCLDDNRSARDEFWESITDAGGRAYFVGHDHFYDHAQVKDGDGDPDNDVHQFIIGTAGAPYYDFDGDYSGKNSSYNPVQKHFAKQYGYIVVEIDDMDVRITFKERKGESYVETDSFSYSVTSL